MRTLFQNGSVLVVSLLLLLVITIVGIAGVSNSLLGERVAGNQKLISEAFMKAESGLVATMKHFSKSENISSWPSSSTTWDKIKTSSIGLKDANTDLHWYIHSISFTKTEAIVISCGEHKLDKVRRCLKGSMLRTSGDGNLAAMNVIGTIQTFSPHSNPNFEIIGEKDKAGNLIGPAIATSSQQNVQKIISGSKKQILDTYVGGVREVIFTGPFGSAEEMNKFLIAVKDECDTKKIACLKNADINPTNLTLKPGISTVYYLECRPSCTFNGNQYGVGLLIIDGNLIINGNFEFDGLVLVTGNQAQINGLGSGGIKGAIAVTHLTYQESGWTFGSATATIAIDMNGLGAKSQIAFDREKIANANNLLGVASKAIWNFTPTNPTSGGVNTFRMTAWSEVFL